MSVVTNETGSRYGRLLVTERVGTSRNGRALWLARCDCGATVTVKGQHLRDGSTTSCGCSNPQMVRVRAGIRDEGARTPRNPTWRCWISMIQRCHNPKHLAFSAYGAKGITVCERWRDYKNFLEDLGERPSTLHSIDRINNSLGYVPGNCRWATQVEQNRNRTNNRRLTFGGETLTVAEWGERTGITSKVIRGRLALGWSIEDSLTTPPARRKPRGRQATAE